MVRRSLQKHIDDAIGTVVEDVSPDLITNWCTHIKIEQQTVSLVGQMMGLPIGPKSVECPYFHGWQAMMASQVATMFIEANCYGCPHHEEVHPNNIGREIVERVAKRKDREANVEAAQKELERLTPEEPCLALDHDPDSDESVKELAGLLPSNEHKRRAASSLLAAARHRPEVFSPKSAKVMQGAFFDPEVGSEVIETVRFLGEHDHNVLREAVDAAKATLARSSNEVAASALLVDAVEMSVIDASVELAGLLVDALPVPHHFLERGGRGRPTEGVKDATRRLAKINFNVVSEAVQERLRSEHDYFRAKGAAGAQSLVEVDADAAIASLLNPLLDALTFEDEDGATDATIHEALAMMLRRGGKPVAERLFEAAERSDPDVRGTILATFRFDEALEGETEQWLPKLISHVSEARLSPSDRQSVAETLSAIAHRCPRLFTPYLEQLLGALAMISEQEQRHRDQKPKEDQTPDWEAFFRHGGEIAAFGLVIRLLRETIVGAAAGDLDSALDQLGQLLANTPTETAATFKGELLAVVGEIGKEYESETRQCIPLIFPHLLDPKSALVRTRAADACDDLVMWNRNVLPDEVLIALAALLTDEYLGPVKGAVRALRRARLEDRGLAGTVASRLAAIYRAYRNDRGQFYFIRDLVDTLTNMAGQHAHLVPVTGAILADGASLTDFYAAEECLQRFGWFAVRHPEWQGQYVDSLISYYARFRLAMVSNGGGYGHGHPDREFQRLYDLDPEAVRARASGLVEMALAQEYAFNKVHIALVLAAVELPDKAADLLEAYWSSDTQPRTAYDRDRFRALALLLRGEAALENGHDREAIRLLEEATDALSSLVRPARGLPFGIDDILPKDEDRADPYVEWANIRKAWLGLAEGDHTDAARVFESLARQLHVLRDAETGTDDDTFLRVLTEAAEGAKHVCLWYEGVRTADPDRDAHLDAARARLAEAATHSEESRWKLFAGRIKQLSGLLEDLKPPRSVRGFLHAVRMLEFPFPTFDMPTGMARRRTRRARGWAATPDTDAEVQLTAPVAFVKAEIDGMEAPQVTTLIAEQVHDLRLQIELSPPIGGATLRLFPISVLPASAYDFPKSEIQLSETQPTYAVEGALIFKHSQAAGASPQTIKIGLEVEREGESRAIDVFGHRRLSFKVVDKETFRRSLGEQGAALDDVRVDLEKLVSAARDAHRGEEESVVDAILNYAAHHLRDPCFLDPSVTEKDFQRDLARHLWMIFDENALREVKAGRGWVDALVFGVPVELKLAVDAPDIDRFVKSSLPQVTQYTVSQGRQVGVLVVLDMTKREAAMPRLRDDVRVCEGPTAKGLRTTGPVAIVAVVVRGAVAQPSALRS